MSKIILKTAKWYLSCTAFELWPCDVSFTLPVYSTKGRHEPAAHFSANAGYSGPERHWSGVLNGYFCNFTNFSAHKCDRRTTRLCSCRGNECTCAHVPCHTIQLIFAYIKFWGSHGIYSRNTAYIPYSCGLVIDSVWYYTFSQNYFCLEYFPFLL